MDDALTHLRFVRSMLGLLALSAFAILSFTISVDPYEAFGAPRVRGYSERKIDSGNDRLVKAGALRHGLYKSIILGTSQAQFGLDPEHASLAELPGPTYNAGLLRGSPYQLRRYLQGANHAGQVEKALLLVDLLMFNAKSAGDRAAMGFIESRLPTAADGRPQPWAWLGETGDLTFSWSAARLSVTTVLKQSRPEAEWILPSGLQNPHTVEAELLGRRGPQFAFEEAERRYGLWFDGFALAARRSSDAEAPDALTDFSELVDYARREGIELTVAIAPTHARYVQMLWALELASEIDELKRQLSSILAAEGRSKGAPAFPLWDFSAAHPLTSEAVPSEVGPKVRMSGYYDSAHFTPRLGNLLFSRLAGKTPAGAEDFGVRLTPEKLEAELARSQRSHLGYASSHAAEVTDLRARVAKNRTLEGPRARRR